MILGAAEAAFTEAEAANLADALMRLRRLSKKPLIKAKPESKAWANLALVALSIYGPRLAAIVIAWLQTRQARRAAEPGKPFVVVKPEAAATPEAESPSGRVQ